MAISNQVSFLENSLQMGDTLSYYLNLFSDGVFRLFALVSLIFQLPFLSFISFYFSNPCILPVYYL